MTVGFAVVVPAFNEEGLLEEAVTFLVRDLSSTGVPVDVVIVNDGSQDTTGVIGEALAKEHAEVRIVHHAANRGWGEAVRTGIANAKYDLVVLSPVDSPVSGREILDLLAAIQEADIAIGYRIGRPGYSWWLRFGSWCYHGVVKSLFGLPFRDVNWIHMYRKSVIESLPLKLTGIVFPAEVLVKARRRGYRIVEIRSSMKARPSGRPTVSRPRVIIRAIGDLIWLWREMRKPEWTVPSGVGASHA